MLEGKGEEEGRGTERILRRGRLLFTNSIPISLGQLYKGKHHSCGRGGAMDGRKLGESPPEERGKGDNKRGGNPLLRGTVKKAGREAVGTATGVG